MMDGNTALPYAGREQKQEVNQEEEQDRLSIAGPEEEEEEEEGEEDEEEEEEEEDEEDEEDDEKEEEEEMANTMEAFKPEISHILPSPSPKHLRPLALGEDPTRPPPPLPLPHFSPREEMVHQALTGFDDNSHLPTVELPPDDRSKHQPTTGDPLYPPWISHRLGSYMSLRERENTISTTNNTDDSSNNRDPPTIGTSTSSNSTSINASSSSISSTSSSFSPTRRRPSEVTTLVYFRPDPGDLIGEDSPPPFPPDDHHDTLAFDSFFESGNLKQALRVMGRVYHPPPFTPTKTASQVAKDLRKTTTISSAPPSFPSVVVPSHVDQEYDLWCKNDTYTAGNIQWYYFSVQVKKAGRVRFNIVNMMKLDSLYNYGMMPCVYSLQDKEKHHIGWSHRGEDITYFRNSRTYIARKANKSEKLKRYYTLSFVYDFKNTDDKVYFAHCYPYTYTDLQRDIKEICDRPSARGFCKRRALCTTIAGNQCEGLTITSYTEDPRALKRRPGIVISARVHPGESNSSYMVKGLIDYLSSDTPQAKILRDHFVFKVAPMLNPDGVINGNYRSSLAGCDLNRRYAEPSRSLHPTVCAIKYLLKSTQESRGVFLYIDLHGHSRNKNTFLYGCDALLEGMPLEDKIFPRVVPRLLSNISAAAMDNPQPPVSASSTSITTNTSTIKQQQGPSSSSSSTAAVQAGYFSFRDCSFSVQASKASTGRVVAWTELGIINAFTLEASFCGNGRNEEQRVIRALSRQETTKLKDLMKDYGDVRPASANNIPYVNDHVNKSNSRTGTRGEADIPEDKVELLTSYRNYFHFSQMDLENMGRRVAETILHYANLYNLLSLDTKATGRYQGHGTTTHGGNDCDDGNGTVKQVHGHAALQRPTIRPVVPEDKPMAFTCPSAVLDAQAAQELSSKWERAKAEVEVRSSLGRLGSTSTGGNGDGGGPSPRAKKGGLKKQISRKATREDEDEEEEEGEDDDDDEGSDSDPSGDNLPASVLQKSRVWLNTIARAQGQQEEEMRRMGARRAARRSRKGRRKKKKGKKRGNKGASLRRLVEGSKSPPIGRQASSLDERHSNNDQWSSRKGDLGATQTPPGSPKSDRIGSMKRSLMTQPSLSRKQLGEAENQEVPKLEASASFKRTLTTNANSFMDATFARAGYDGSQVQPPAPTMTGRYSPYRLKDKSSPRPRQLEALSLESDNKARSPLTGTEWEWSAISSSLNDYAALNQQRNNQQSVCPGTRNVINTTTFNPPLPNPASQANLMMDYCYTPLQLSFPDDHPTPLSRAQGSPRHLKRGQSDNYTPSPPRLNIYTMGGDNNTGGATTSFRLLGTKSPKGSPLNSSTQLTPLHLSRSPTSSQRDMQQYQKQLSGGEEGQRSTFPTIVKPSPRS